jgi:uncharacterized protein YbjT (DUF2867 family)
MIVVTGATGKIGRELMRLLSERREAVQAVAHTDLAQPDRLASAFAGAEKLFLLTANTICWINATTSPGKAWSIRPPARAGCP